MIVLPPVTYNQYKCEFCSRIYKVKHAAVAHENKCYKNPNRDCATCDNTGIVIRMDFSKFNVKKFISDIIAHKLEVSPMKEEPCDTCKIAAKLGGKSYLK